MFGRVKDGEDGESDEGTQYTSFTSRQFSVLKDQFGRMTSVAAWAVDKEYKGHKRYFTIAMTIVLILYFFAVEIPLTVIVNAETNSTLSLCQVFVSLPAEAIVRAQGLNTRLVVNDLQLQRIFLHAFGHIGVLHLFSNLLGFVWMSKQLEQDFGQRPVITIYMASLFGAALLSMLTLPANSVGVGASGAILGLYGAKFSFLVLNYTLLKDTILVEGISLFLMVALSIGFGLFPNVGNGAHLGGFIVGIAAGFTHLTLPRYQAQWSSNRDLLGKQHPEVNFEKKKEKLYQKALGRCGVLVNLALIITGFSLLFTENLICDGCLTVTQDVSLNVNETEAAFGTC